MKEAANTPKISIEAKSPLIYQYYVLQELTPLHSNEKCWLSGFIGPVPPPLWIRVFLICNFKDISMRQSTVSIGIFLSPPQNLDVQLAEWRC